MFMDTMKGLDKIFKTDISAPKVVLITGPPGSMKTSFIYSIISKYVTKTGKFGLYTTLEESVESHLANMDSLGINLSLNMQISDLTDIREIDELAGDDDEATDYLDFIERMILMLKRKKGDNFEVFALDSLGALYSLMGDTKNARKKMFYFFKMLRDQNLMSFIVMERALGGESNLLGNEGFLVDGIIMLGLDRTRGKLTRYIQVEKMRATKHSMEKHAVEVGGDGGLSVLGPLFDG